MLQPASRHWSPASRKILCSPSASAWRLTSPLPGTTMASTPRATRWPRTTAAAARRSSIRPFVHDPMNTRSTPIEVIGVPGARPMYSSAFSAALRSVSSASAAGSGTQAPTSATWPGFVPQVTCGWTSAARNSATRS